MAESNKRGKDRIVSKNLVSYTCIDDNKEAVDSGMGRTLNVSESGIMIETHNDIDEQLNVLLSIGLENELIDIKGKIIHSTSVDAGKYQIGIQFIGLEDATKSQLIRFIDVFNSS